MTEINLNKTNNRKFFILLIDDVSKEKVSASLVDLSNSGVFFVNKLKEITQEMLEKTRTVFILEPYMHDGNALPTLRLFKKLMSLNYIYLGCDEFWTREMSDLARVYSCNILEINYELLFAAAINDTSKQIAAKASNFYDSSGTFADEIIRSKSSKEIRQLAQDFQSAMSLLEKMKQDKELYRNKVAELIHEKSILEEENRKLSSAYKEILVDSYKLNETLHNYEGILTKDIYRKVNLSDYDSRPLVLYFKEFEELQGFYLFIDTLYEVLRFQNQNSVKTLLLFDSATSKRMNTLPAHYQKIYNSFQTKHVIVNDFIAKTGDPTDVLDILLKNRERVNVLLIFDCKSMQDIVVTGPCLQMNLCCNPEHLEAFHLVADNTIVNASDDTYYLPFDYDKYKEEFSKVKDNNDRFIYLSSQKIYRNLLKQTKLFRDSM